VANPSQQDANQNGTGDACEESQALDLDGDGFDDTVDCDDTDYTISPGANESCNGMDDNCNDVIDEGCGNQGEQDCSDGIDDDSDGVIDCQDPDCNGVGSCGNGPEHENNCADNFDDDGDGDVDCEDSDCAQAPSCQGGSGSCVPVCQGKQCGEDDGCGGECGICGQNQVCQNDMFGGFTCVCAAGFGEVTGTMSMDFESGNLPPFTGDWNVVAHPAASSGQKVAQSTNTTGGTTSFLELVVDVGEPSGGGVDFKYRVDSLQGVDKLRFKVDGQQIDEWSGDIAVSAGGLDLSFGAHTLRWEFARITGIAGYAFVDDISVSGVNIPGVCQDIDECSLGTDNCGDVATCLNSNGSYACECESGYQFSTQNQLCVDIDECALNNGDCGNATCNNFPGGFSCMTPG